MWSKWIKILLVFTFYKRAPRVEFNIRSYICLYPTSSVRTFVCGLIKILVNGTVISRFNQFRILRRCLKRSRLTTHELRGYLFIM
jgi:hypothetical protein